MKPRLNPSIMLALLCVDTLSEAVSLPLAGLEPGRLYHYRIVASNVARPFIGACKPLTPPSPAAHSPPKSAW